MRLPQADVTYVLEHTDSLWSQLANAHIFLTGGTGFFGIWLLETFLAANEHYQLNAKITVLTRDSNAFLTKQPWLKEHRQNCDFIDGDVKSITISKDYNFTHIIHAATESSAKLNKEHPLLMLDTVVAGTRTLLDLAKQLQIKSLLFVSSGAVYGTQPFDLERIPENFIGAPDPLDTGAAYANGKRYAEHLCALYGKQYNIRVKIARCFAFVGPYLPLTTHFAIGNFINNVLQQQPIVIAGDGSPVRSYLYAADLAINLWTILLRGQVAQAYNVGSDVGVSIKDLAYIVAECGDPAVEVIIKGDSACVGQSSRYVPDVSKGAEEFSLPEPISLKQSILKTLLWYKNI